METKIPKDNTILDVREITCSRYDDVLFSELSFKLTYGQLLQIEGENGSGKTTLLKTICGLIEPDVGEIRWQGQKIKEAGDDYRAELNYIGHNNGVKAGLTCIENLKVAGALASRVITTDIDQVLDDYGLYGYQDSYAYSLSAGQRRRLALARLSLRYSRFWILDEPFTSLDEKGKRLMKGIFYKHLDAGGMIIMTSHDLIQWENISPVRIGL